MNDIATLIIADIFPQTAAPYSVIVARLVGALALVAIIGVERESQDRPAGLRTHMLVALAAAIFGVLAGEITNAPGNQGDHLSMDPLRVVEAVTAGVAFLAAGFIFFSRGRVHGLTTGAGIWLAGAIGLSVGFGFWIVAIVGTIIGTIVLRALLYVESWAGWKRSDGDEGNRAEKP